MKAKKFDIAICTKNNEPTILQSLQRIVRYASPSRLIVIDGNSTDRTTELASKIGAEVFSDHGKGLGYARNMALNLSETELLGYVDADAFITEDWLDILRHMNDPMVAAVSAATIYGYGNPPLQRFHEWLAKTKTDDVGFVSTIVRRDIVIGVGGIRQDLQAYEDWELRTRLRKGGFKWIWDRSVHTLHPESLLGFLSHVRRWGQGARKSGLRSEEENLRRIVESCFTSPLWGLKFCFTLHPIFAVYYPLLRFSFLKGYAEASRPTERA